MQPSAEQDPLRTGDDEGERVPVFGTWRRIYAAVLVSAALVMTLIALFSTWRW